MLSIAPDSEIARTDQSDYYYRTDSTQPSAIAFDSPVEMLYYCDKNIANDTIKLHTWQLETLKFFGLKDLFTKENPLKYILRAANGSGKDAYIIAPMAVWFILAKVRTRVIATSSSKAQLKQQTEAYIRNICTLLNAQFAADGVSEQMFIIQRNHIVCTLTGSEIILFATNEGGKAEGYHPFPDCPTQELMIIINEAKTLDGNIVEHLSRCTYSHWLEISSPGPPSGHFYHMYCLARDWKDGYVPGTPITRKITSYDCKHVSRSKIEQDKLEYGENSFVFRTKHLAEFSTLGELVVMPGDLVDSNWNLRGMIKEIPVINGYSGTRAGLDLSGGGDEQVLIVIRNNCVIALHYYELVDTDRLVEVMIEHFKDYRLKAEYIHADDGGIGKGILDNFRGRGWDLHRVLNQSSPLNSREYGNRGAELWFNIKRLFEARLIKFCIEDDDGKLKQQLRSRYYTQHKTTGRTILEAKSDARKAGHPSPDRADAFCLAFAGLSIFDFNPDLAGKVDSRSLKPAPNALTIPHTELVKNGPGITVSKRQGILNYKLDRSNSRFGARHRDYDYLMEQKAKSRSQFTNFVSLTRKLLTGA